MYCFQIEETILESLAWKSESQLWADIRKSNQELPKFEDTALPGNIKYGDASKPIATINRIIPASEYSSNFCWMFYLCVCCL